MKYYIAATAGHVDHGKSALVRALSGTDPDRLPEEKARGITIDLGFAHVEVTVGSEPCLVGLVDVPGHEDFVKNMVAGVGAVDLALLVVAADDGWMPQTEEHVQILTWLGVRRAVVALTKADLAEDRLRAVTEQLRVNLAGTPFARAPVVPTSVVSGQGIDTFRAALAAVLTDLPVPRDVGKPRLPIDRVFVLHGVGTVVTGTLSGGCFDRGQTALVQPEGHATRLRAIQCYGSDVPSSGPGRRTALNLADLSKPVGRGDVIAAIGEPTWAVDVKLSGPRVLSPTDASLRGQLKSGGRFQLHHGSKHVSARLFLLEGENLRPGEEALAELRLEAPMLIFGGDRFVLRDSGEQVTLGGGVVLDPHARPRRFRTPEQRDLLARRAQAIDDVAVWAQTELLRDRMLPSVGLLAQTGFGGDEITAALVRLEQQGVVSQAGSWWMDAVWWRELQEEASAAVGRFHREHPELGGMELNQLQTVLVGRLPVETGFNLLIDALTARGYVRTRTLLRHQAHRPALPPHLQADGERIRAALAAKPMEPPAKKDLAGDRAGQQALRFLQESGEVVGVSDELVLSAESYAGMAAQIVQILRRDQGATVSGLRQQLGTTRRVLVPLLEHLDKEGVTTRQGDLRILGRRAPLK